MPAQSNVLGADLGFTLRVEADGWDTFAVTATMADKTEIGRLTVSADRAPDAIRTFYELALSNALRRVADRRKIHVSTGP